VLFLHANQTNTMIYRIQTVFMALAFIVSGILSLLLPLWKTVGGQSYYAANNGLFTVAFGLSAALCVFAILNYKKKDSRLFQIKMNRVNIILNFILLGLFVYQSLSLSGETQVSEKGIGMFLPLASIFLLVFANKAIKKDEDLVKSADRIR